MSMTPRTDPPERPEYRHVFSPGDEDILLAIGRELSDALHGTPAELRLYEIDYALGTDGEARRIDIEFRGDGQLYPDVMGVLAEREYRLGHLGKSDDDEWRGYRYYVRIPAHVYTFYAEYIEEHGVPEPPKTSAQKYKTPYEREHGGMGTIVNVTHKRDEPIPHPTVEQEGDA